MVEEWIRERGTGLGAEGDVKGDGFRG